jgi:hypothetical protein
MVKNRKFRGRAVLLAMTIKEKIVLGVIHGKEPPCQDRGGGGFRGGDRAGDMIRLKSERADERYSALFNPRDRHPSQVFHPREVHSARGETLFLVCSAAAETVLQARGFWLSRSRWSLSFAGRD